MCGYVACVVLQCTAAFSALAHIVRVFVCLCLQRIVVCCVPARVAVCVAVLFVSLSSYYTVVMGMNEYSGEGCGTRVYTESSDRVRRPGRTCIVE